MKTLKRADGKMICFDEDAIKGAMNEYARSVSAVFKEANINGDSLFLASNIVGEYAELIACSNLDLRKENASRKAYDAVGEKDGKTYQIKSRWMNGFGTRNGKNEFGRIKKSSINKVDYLVLVVFPGDNFNKQELYTIDLQHDLQKIFDAYDMGILSQKIVSFHGNPGSQEYIFRYYRTSFAQAVKLGLMKRVSLGSSAPANPSPSNFNLKHFAIANAYLRQGYGLMKLESLFNFPDTHGSTAKRILNDLGIDTSSHGDKGALIGRTVTDVLANPSINATYKATLEAIKMLYGD